MASVPLTEEQITEDLVVLNIEKIGLTDEQFFDLCGDNRDFQFELTAQKELLIMTPPGPHTGRRNEDPFQMKVYIYRTGQPVECLINPVTLDGAPVLPGFVFQISEVWS